MATDGGLYPHGGAQRTNNAKSFARYRQAIPHLRNAFLALAALALSSCHGPFVSYRYRLTVTVETPQGEKSGSSVLQSNESDNRGVDLPLLSNSFVTRMTGEAVFVDLGERKNLIALMTCGQRGRDLYKFQVLAAVTIERATGKLPWQLNARELKTLGPFEVPEDFIPTLLTFSDLTNAELWRVVPEQDFEKIFGAGYQLKRVTVELTDAPVTVSIEEKLPWLASMRKGRQGAFSPWFNSPLLYEWRA
jgi:hypothetical protein